MKKSNLPYVLIALLIIWSLVLSIVCFGSLKTNNNKEVVNEYVVNGFSTDFTKVVEANKTSIVTINCNGSISSGFVYKQIDNKVYIVTSYHGLSNGVINVYFDNEYSAYGTIVGKDIYADIAIISVDSQYSISPLQMGDASSLKDGEFVICIGTPTSIEYAGSVELGLISSDTRVVENSISVNNIDSDYYLDVIQLSANLKPGYSGSPVLNMNGEVVGMVSMSIEDNMNFALTANEIKIIAENIIAGNQYVKYQTGIKGTFINDMPTYVKSNLNLPLDLLNGLYVNKVLVGSIANIGEIKTGDVILSINGSDITNLNSYLNALYSKTDLLEFKVLRAGNTITLMVHIND